MSLQPRHVLMTADAVGGVWTYALDLAEGLLARGVGVTLAVIGPPLGLAQHRAAQGIAGLKIIEAGQTLDWLADRPEQLHETTRVLQGLAARSGADLVHLNAPALGGDADWGAPVVGVCHSCVATWWDAVRGDALPPDFAWRTERLAEGYRRCDRLIAPTETFARATADRYSVRPAVVLNGRRDATRGVEQPRRRVVTTAGRLWDDGKNIAFLHRAAGRMRGVVEAAGALTGPNGQSIRLTQIAALGQIDADELQRRLRTTAVFCSTALYEPFGLGVLEAAQAGCALVLSDIPTFRELWDGAAVFVSLQDNAALAQTLDALLDDVARTAALGRLAEERARRFTVDRMVEGTLAVYADALARWTTSGEAAA